MPDGGNRSRRKKTQSHGRKNLKIATFGRARTQPRPEPYPPKTTANAYGDKITGKNELRHAVRGIRPGIRRLRSPTGQNTAPAHAAQARFRSPPVVRRVRRGVDRRVHPERDREFQRPADSLRHRHGNPRSLSRAGARRKDLRTLHPLLAGGRNPAIPAGSPATQHKGGIGLPEARVRNGA